ncbi:MAG: hypothetical protein UU12_C0009G0016 [Candidatus Woesebacteria bacterium GW2011_GWA2_40_7b]|uniref:SCP domain-containing protein n=1 Tax=Candidatus Woesebacteria bacterium GW2011_GWA2_40_7b TaxID=1618563 RepID=A0A0G0W762_9BACT|nr:MAG: hypothetical protein UU12_C0009G0016 [Candidatus Woesebacteria bacterium GW2011_GWA2_40_7b]
MKLLKFLRHLFIPHASNNQKAKILHPSSLSVIVVFLITFQVILSFTHGTFPRVLGYAASIPPSEVIRLTNAERIANGLSVLDENRTLDLAALAKGNDMLAKGYWAHFAPDGTSPWSFFTSFGYKYRYAGENLARDFSDPTSAVNAWMNSPSHRENILNSNYSEIGVGVIEGTLSGADTTIIVQFFASPLSAAPSVPIVKAGETSMVAIVSSPLPTPGVAVSSFISPFQTTKGLSFGVTGVLLLVLSVDLIVVRRRRIARIGGRTLAHLAYLGMILAVILILKAGQII